MVQLEYEAVSLQPDVHSVHAHSSGGPTGKQQRALRVVKLACLFAVVVAATLKISASGKGVAMDGQEFLPDAALDDQPTELLTVDLIPNIPAVNGVVQKIPGVICNLNDCAAVVPSMPSRDISNVMEWIKVRVATKKLPFCWRDSYGRGVGEVPGRAADCPKGYTNNGFFCGRGTDDIYAPSKTPSCPSGYYNIGLWCQCDGWCLDTLGPSHFRCPSGYFLNKLTHRCHKHCPKGYTNTGETCHQSASTMGIDSLTCGSHEHRVESAFGVRCYGGNSAFSCHSHEVYDAGLCYDQCKPGFTGVGPVCWQDCPGSHVHCGAACAEDAKTCAEEVSSMVVASLVLASNVATAGMSSRIAKGAKSIKLGSKTYSGTSRLGKAAVKALDKLKDLKKMSKSKKVKLWRKRFDSATGKLESAAEAYETAESVIETMKYLDEFTGEFSEMFKDITTEEVAESIDRHYQPATADFLKKEYAKIFLQEMVDAAGEVDIGDALMQTAAAVDPTGVMDVVNSFNKPACDDHTPFPCTTGMKTKAGCRKVRDFACHPGRYCKGRNELGTMSGKDWSDCAEKCRGIDDCIAFDFDSSNGWCGLSTSCKQEFWSQGDAELMMCQKGVFEPHFNCEIERGCVGRNELGGYKLADSSECADKCREIQQCISYEWYGPNKWCQLSTSCTDDLARVSPQWTLCEKEFKFADAYKEK